MTFSSLYIVWEVRGLASIDERRGVDVAIFGFRLQICLLLVFLHKAAGAAPLAQPTARPQFAFYLALELGEDLLVLFVLILGWIYLLLEVVQQDGQEQVQ